MRQQLPILFVTGLAVFLCCCASSGLSERRALLSVFKAKIAAKKYTDLKGHMYEMVFPDGSNVTTLMGKMTRGFAPSPAQFQTLIDHVDAFKLLYKSPVMYALVSQALRDKTIKDPQKAFSHSLAQKNDKIFILADKDSKAAASVIVFKFKGSYKMVWWKDLSRLVQSLKAPAK